MSINLILQIMRNIVFNKLNSDADEFESPEDAGAGTCVVIAGFLLPVIGLGILGYNIDGSWLALAGAVTGGILGVFFNKLFALIAKWGSLIGLAGIAIYGTIITLI
jgi:hypothetical protein